MGKYHTNHCQIYWSYPNFNNFIEKLESLWSIVAADTGQKVEILSFLWMCEEKHGFHTASGLARDLPPETANLDENWKCLFLGFSKVVHFLSRVGVVYFHSRLSLSVFHLCRCTAVHLCRYNNGVGSQKPRGKRQQCTRTMRMICRINAINRAAISR